MNTAKDAEKLRDRLTAEGKSKAEIIRALTACCMDWPYVFGSYGQMCTPENRRKYAGYRPDHKAKIYGACPVLSGKEGLCAGCKWNGCRMFDCRGFNSWLAAQAGLALFGGTVTAQWETQSNWAVKGDIRDMPRDLVCCVFREGHTGMYLGNGLVRHCSTRVKEEPLPGTPRWLRYGIPAGLYRTEELRKAGLNVDESKNIPTLRRSSQGEAVKELQTLLSAKYGADLDADGEFGKKTEQAVKAFQSAHGLTADGIAGPKMWKALGVTPGSSNPDTAEDPTSCLSEELPQAGVWVAQEAWQTLKAAIAMAGDIIKEYEQGGIGSHETNH